MDDMFGNFDQDRTWTDAAQVCGNGHCLNPSSKKYPIHNKKFCPDCGESTTTQCLYCGVEIPGEIHYENVFGSSNYKVPIFCSSCGKPYSWTEKKLNAAKELATELEELSAGEKKVLEKSIEEISKNNTQATVGATRFNKLMLKVSTSAGNILKDVITDVASETAKKILLGK